MSNQPTPETDAFIGEGNDGSYMTEGEIAMCDFARKLERQRNELRTALQAIVDCDCPLRFGLLSQARTALKNSST